MNRMTAIALASAFLLAPGLAWSQETMPEPDAQTPAEEAGEAVSDAWITAKVKADLVATSGVPGSDIGVDTSDGVVTLTGSVATQAEADKAVSVASLIKGVKRVDSQIAVGDSTP